MPSPFPGMDPWLESPSIFPGLHASLTSYLLEAINARLPSGYFAAINMLVWVDPEQRVEPDVSVTGPARPAGGVAVLEAPAHLHPLGLVPQPLPVEEPYLEIRAADGERVVTAVEVLSRANKAVGSAGRKAYLDKQREFSLGGVHLVEIDLLRDGVHTTAAPRNRLARLAGGPFHYHVCVTEAGTPDRLYGAVFPLAEPLPTIDIPLDPGVPRIAIDLQPLLDRAYDAGRFAMRARYGRPADPPLPAADQVWADALLRSKFITRETP